MKWIKKWRSEEEDFLDESLAIQELVQKRVIEKLWLEPGEKMRFYQCDIIPMITYTKQQYLLEKMSMHKKHLFCHSGPRISSRHLIETGRWENINREEYICLFCKQGEIENGVHVMIHCPCMNKMKAHNSAWKYN